MQEKFNVKLKYSEEKTKTFKDYVSKIKKDESKIIDTYFFHIKDLDNFLLQFYFDENGKVTGRRRAKFCTKCITVFYDQKPLNEHKKLCSARKDYYKEIMPKNSAKHNKSRKFDKHYALERNPVNIFCDFEAILEPKEEGELCKTCHKNGMGRVRCTCGDDQVSPVKVHRPACFALIAVNAKGEIINERIVSMQNDEEVVLKGSQVFIETLLEDEAFYKSFLKEDKSRPPTGKDIKAFVNSTKCCICAEDFNFAKGDCLSLPKEA